MVRSSVKDARSVSLYPHNWSHIFQYVKYTNLINTANGIAFFQKNNAFLCKKVKGKNTIKTKQNINIKTLAEAVN